MLISGIIMIVSGVVMILVYPVTDIIAINCIYGAISILIGACFCLKYVSDVDNRIRDLGNKLFDIELQNFKDDQRSDKNVDGRTE